MSKRAFDVTVAVTGLALTWPLLAVAAIGIKLTSPGPVLYRAHRAGRFGVPFAMLKLRTMRADRSDAGPRITAAQDPRVFPFGAFLRRTKIDELPQLVNILRGEMSVIGPRPEDPHFVRNAYTTVQRATLLVRPGLSSPGSLYHDEICDGVLSAGDTDATYVERMLPVKLALDLDYVRRASIGYDVRLVLRTLRHIARRVAAGLLIAFTAGASCEQAPFSPSPSWLTDDSETILVGAGDIGTCNDETDDETASLLDSIPGTVFTTGDNAYPSGTATQFAECYGSGWGRHFARTRPTPGNHDYYTPGATGYFAYFGDRAGPAGKGYYSYALGAWHVIALNSEIAIGEGSEQLAWLVADLAATNAHCVVAYWHRPRFSSGSQHGNTVEMQPAWEALYAAGADVVIAGHEHLYERFAPQTPEGVADPLHGIRQFVVGTGGSEMYPFGSIAANSEFRLAETPGVLALRLMSGEFEWRFVTAPGAGVSEGGSGRCHGPPPSPAPEVG